MGSSDRHLAGQIQNGVPGAFAALVDTLGPRLHALTRRYALTESDAEDLTQEIFVDLYRCIGRFRGESSLTTWAYAIALNHCRKSAARIRAAATVAYTVAYDEARNLPAGEQCGPAAEAARRELSDRVSEALNALSPEQREVVVLHELQELTYRECAEALQIPEGTVKSRLFHAFRRLRGSLHDYVQADLPLEAAP